LNDCDTIRFGLDKVEYNFEFVCNRGLEGELLKATQQPREEQVEYLFQKIRDLSLQNEDLKKDNNGINQKIETLKRENEEQVDQNKQELRNLVERTTNIVKSFGEAERRESLVDIIASNLDAIEKHMKALSNTLLQSKSELEDLTIENKYDQNVQLTRVGDCCPRLESMSIIKTT
jgi:DNA repair exonuclease SbcCD ATPase subunit